MYISLSIQPCSSVLCSSLHTRSVVHSSSVSGTQCVPCLSARWYSGWSGVWGSDTGMDWPPVLCLSLHHWLLGLYSGHTRSHVSYHHLVTSHTLTTHTPSHPPPSLTVPDLTPNVGLFWYFFTEAFEHFRVFFLCVFQINAFLYVLPLSVRFRSADCHMTILPAGPGVSIFP